MFVVSITNVLFNVVIFNTVSIYVIVGFIKSVRLSIMELEFDVIRLDDF